MTTLVIDIGGIGMKALVLDSQGRPINEFVKLATPSPGKPDAVLDVVQALRDTQPEHSRISVGFPGVVKKNVVYNAPNLGNEYWNQVPLAHMLTQKTGLGARVINDADLQGLGVVSGEGIELVLTFGTGLGAALFADGTLMPNIELGHHPFGDGRSYEDHVGDAELKTIGAEAWNKMVRKQIAQLQAFFNYDRLYLGGGNARHLAGALPDNVTIFTLNESLAGGHKLWERD